MNRYWFLTWTTYGTWLPGDPRGFVSRVVEGADPGGPRIEHDRPQSEPLKDIPELVRASRFAMKGPAVWLDADRARVVANDFASTVRFRGWELVAGSIIANHVHLLIGVPEDPDPARVLSILKSYASRALNHQFTKPPGGTWWTASGSRRKISGEKSLAMVAEYIRTQIRCLVVCEPVRSESPDFTTEGERGTKVPRE